MLESELRIVGENHISWNGQLHPFEVKETGESEGSGTYRWEAIRFQDELDQTADACLFIIPPRTASMTVMILGDIQCHDAGLRGEGQVIVKRPDGKEGVDVYSFGRPDSNVVVYSSNTVVTYVSHLEELRILGLYIPHFQPNNEVEIPVNQNTFNELVIPDTYWTVRRALLNH